MEELTIFKVFALIDDNNNITDITGGILTDTAPTGYIQIDEGNGDKYAHCQGNYFDGAYKEDYLDGVVYLYKYEGEVVEKTADEIEADKEIIEANYNPAPTTDERLTTLEETQEEQDEVIAEILTMV
jgi:hypothetical protein